jgi:hypothetical protein
MKFKDWFSSKLTVGAFPYKQDENFDASKYDVVINVSDEFYFDIEQQLQNAGCKTYWFPMNEAKRDIGVNSIYGAMVIIQQAEKHNKSVYVHCHAGLNRSPTVWAAYYFMRTGKDAEWSRGSFVNRLAANCTRGYLPPQAEMKGFLGKVASLTKSMQGGILDEAKIGTINNF